MFVFVEPVFQEYVPPPVAVSVIVFPLQTDVAPSIFPAGDDVFVKTTVLVLAAQGASLIVHVKVVELLTPVTVELFADGVVIVTPPHPLVQDHDPVPVVAIFPASVKFPLLQFVCEEPALETVGVAFTTIE